MLPKDSYILLSYLNTKLRDSYPTLTELCKAENADIENICEQMLSIGYKYNADTNSFIR